jgi:hypothetical protein
MSTTICADGVGGAEGLDSSSSSLLAAFFFFFFFFFPSSSLSLKMGMASTWYICVCVCVSQRAHALDGTNI